MSFLLNSPIIGSKKLILVQAPSQISGSCFFPSAHGGYLYLIYHQFKKSSKIRSFLQKYSILCKIKKVIVIFFFFFFQLSLARKRYKLNISFGNLKLLIIKKKFFLLLKCFFFFNSCIIGSKNLISVQAPLQILHRGPGLPRPRTKDPYSNRTKKQKNP